MWNNYATPLSAILAMSIVIAMVPFFEKEDPVLVIASGAIGLLICGITDILGRR